MCTLLSMLAALSPVVFLLAVPTFDFAFTGALLFGAGLAYEPVARKAGTMWYRAAAGVALAAALLLVWMNGADGIIGNENDDANLTVFGVLAVGISGPFIARFKPDEMARALFATALSIPGPANHAASAAPLPQEA